MGDLSVEVENLVASGAKFYAAKDFESASEVYGKACEVYSQETEEQDSGDLLLLYGKSLFQLAVEKSEVLGGVKKEKAVSEEGEKKSEEEGFQFESSHLVEEESDDEEEHKGKGKENVEVDEEEEKEVDEEEGEEQEQVREEGEEEEGESDFEFAWNILDAARSIFERQLEDENKTEEQKLERLKDNEIAGDPVVALQVKLSQTFDLLGEVSLEAENYQQAFNDFNDSLKLRKIIYKPYSSLISETYYKMSLALEFVEDEGAARAKAIEYTELAIEAIEKNPEQKDEKEKKSLIGELKDRVEDLGKDPLQEQKDLIMNGLLGEVAQAVKGAPQVPKAVNDLSTSVKKRKGPNVMKGVKKSKK